MQKSHVNDLIVYCVNMAKLFLQEQGEFYPFGVGLDSGGNFININPYKGDAFPLSDLLIRDLKELGDTALINKYVTAYAIGFDSKVASPHYNNPIDAIVLIVRGINKEARKYYYPYSIKDEKIAFYEPWAETEK